MPKTEAASQATQQGARNLANQYLFRVRDLVYRVAGIFRPNNELHFLEDCCERRMKVVGAHSLREYFGQLTLGADREREMHSLLQEITAGETRFFRNPSQLKALREVVIPALLEAEAKLPAKHFRVWSAGCATGEEPYTLAMVLMEELEGALQGRTIEVVATDWNDRRLAKAEEGVYGAESLSTVPPEYQKKYFVPQDGCFQVCDEIKSCVSFYRLNLLDESKMVFMKEMHAIFCRNVLIYFDGTSKRRLVQHFYHNLVPHGFLFLGKEESLFGIHDDFRLIHFPGTIAYRKT